MDEPLTRASSRAEARRRERRRHRRASRLVAQAVVLAVVAGGTAAFAATDVPVGDAPFAVAGSSLDLRGALAHASRSEVVRADLGPAVSVHVDGREVAVRVEPGADGGPATVRDALRAAEVVLGEHDLVSVPLDTRLDALRGAVGAGSGEAEGVDSTGSAEGSDDAQGTAGLVVVVTRVVAEMRTETTAQPFATVRQDDGALEKGREVVQRAGQVGEQVVAYEAHLVDGEEISRTVLAQRVVREPVDEVVRVGTFEPPPPGATVDPGTARAIGREMVLARGWGEDQWQCLDALWTKESGWSHTAENRSSGAYGIPQSLPGSKMASAGEDWRTNPATQITWGLGYISGRYGTPCGAWAHSQARNWY